LYFDGSSGPDSGQQLVLLDDSTRALDEQDQQIDIARRQLQRLSVAQ
jgi:hypothetical protein